MAGIDLGGVLEIDSEVFTQNISSQGPGEFLGWMAATGFVCFPGSAGGSTSSGTVRNYSFSGGS